MEKLKEWSKLWKRNTAKNYDEFELYIPVDIFQEIETLGNSEQSILLIYYCITKIQNKINNGSKQLRIPELKKLMGYSSSNTKIDYILKKGGLAETIGLIRFEGNTRLINYDGWVNRYVSVKYDPSTTTTPSVV